MNASTKLAALAAAFAMLVTPLSDATAQSRPHSYHRHSAHRPIYTPAPMGYGYGTGAPVGYGYGTGWRHRTNARGWDNTCLDLPWLPSQFACSAK